MFFCVIYSDCHNLYNLPNWVESYICSNIQDFNVKFTIIKPLIELLYECIIYIQNTTMLQNKIYQNYFLEIIKLFITILLSLSLIAWTVRAVNFLDLIVDSGYPIKTYFEYSVLNLFGIVSKFIPLSFLLTITIFIIRQIQENELIILWTSGVKKIQIVNLFFQISIIVTIFHLIFSIFLAPAALNKSRQLLSNENLISILPTFKIQKFSDSFKDLTFIIDNKYENKISNIFLHDESDNLKNIVTNEDGNTSTTIIAKME